MGLEQRNKSKTTYTPQAAIMLDCVLRGTREQGVPMGFCTPQANQKMSFDQRIMSITTLHSTFLISLEAETYLGALTLKSASQHPS